MITRPKQTAGGEFSAPGSGRKDTEHKAQAVAPDPHAEPHQAPAFGVFGRFDGPLVVSPAQLAVYLSGVNDRRHGQNAGAAKEQQDRLDQIIFYRAWRKR